MPALPTAWVYTPLPPKAAPAVVETQTVRATTDALLSYESEPPWSTSMATTYDITTVKPAPPSLIVRRAYTSLPKARHSLDIVETDDVPRDFLEPTPEAQAANSLPLR